MKLEEIWNKNKRFDVYKIIVGFSAFWQQLHAQQVGVRIYKRRAVVTGFCRATAATFTRELDAAT
jgi:hypothetical protein